MRDSLDVFRTLARYNRAANERLYEQCGKLGVTEYRRERPGSFGSIHALLNHTLLGDRIWMSRFAGGGQYHTATEHYPVRDFREKSVQRGAKKTPALSRSLRRWMDGFLTRPLRYRNSLGKDCENSAPHAVLHFFNHQTHHRGQVHVMLSQTDVRPPALDMHRILNP